MGRSSLVVCTIAFALACGVDVVNSGGLSAEDSGGTLGSDGTAAVTGGGDDGTLDDTAGSASADSSTGQGGDDPSVDTTAGDDGGVGGQDCDATQSGLCEDLRAVVHCYSGADGTCGVGECMGGTQTCVPGLDLDLGEWSACEGEVTPAAEVCDGVDNDCDGETDEDLGQTTCGDGLCQHSEDDCVDGRTNACDPMLGAVAEECDGEDNDCDGDIDEDFAGEQTTCGVGQCLHSVVACMAGQVPTCDPLEGATAETCDDEDNDCDGQTDEGLGDLTCGLGVCEQTVPACDAGEPGVCDPFAGASAEICDGLDNDCDGQTDEGFGIVTCGQGICAHDIETCVDGSPTICDPFLGAVAEICFDDLDNDCDGSVDENCDCGDGMIDAGEDCDGANLGGSTCASLGFDGGTLACTACAFDTSGCFGCGDGTIDAGEQCDGANLGGQTCASLGYDGGTLSCSAACQLVESGCYACGDGAIDPGESCDGVNFGGVTCVSLGYDGGTLACAGCTIDPSGCYECGDGTIDAGEQCDGASLNGQTCASLGYDAGTLACNGACNFNVTGCWTCGNGVINPGESCDLGALGGATCQSLGFDAGVLGCNSGCDYDTSGCWECGDGAVNPGELCDGANLNGQTCATLGHAGGTLLCTNGCAFNQNGCFDCGNGVINAPEECDGNAFGGQTCVSLGYDAGSLTCLNNCTIDESGCSICGDDLIGAGELCDGNNLGGQTCVTQGFDGGPLECTNACAFDISGCFNCAAAPGPGGLIGGPPPMAPGDCQPVLSQLTCSSEISGQVVTGPSQVTGPYTCGMPFAGLVQGGPEDVYSFSCQADGAVTLLLTGLLCDLDIYVLTDQCTPNGGCVNGSTAAFAVNDSVTFNCTAGQDYFIVIEGYGFTVGQCGANQGTYTLQFDTSAATGGCLEDCDDGLDNDQDGPVDCNDDDCIYDPVCVCP